MAPHGWSSLRKGIFRRRRAALFRLDLTRHTKPRNLEPIPSIAKYARDTSSVKERAAFLRCNLQKSEGEKPSRTEADCSRPAFLGRENGDDSASGSSRSRVSQTRAAQPLRATATIASHSTTTESAKTAGLWASAAARRIFLCGKARGHDREVRQVQGHTTINCLNKKRRLRGRPLHGIRSFPS